MNALRPLLRPPARFFPGIIISGSVIFRTVRSGQFHYEITFRQNNRFLHKTAFCAFSPKCDFSTSPESVFIGYPQEEKRFWWILCGIPFHMEFFCNIAPQRDPARRFLNLQENSKNIRPALLHGCSQPDVRFAFIFFFFSARLRSSSFAPAYNRKYTVRIITTTILLSFRLKKRGHIDCRQKQQQ